MQSQNFEKAYLNQPEFYKKIKTAYLNQHFLIFFLFFRKYAVNDSPIELTGIAQ
jgi:hypothetical protein